MLMDWYIIVRNEVTQIICCLPGNDPLYGYGSWDLVAGPYTSYEDALGAA